MRIETKIQVALAVLLLVPALANATEVNAKNSAAAQTLPQSVQQNAQPSAQQTSSASKKSSHRKRRGTISSATTGANEGTDSQADAAASTETGVAPAKAGNGKSAQSSAQSPPDKTRGGILKDFDTLGGNDVLLDKAKALNPETRVRVVQNRIVSRRNRVELAPEYSNVLGGDPYNKTQNVGINVHYHITPNWSVGAKYAYSFNELRPEGNSLINDPNVTSQALIADIDYPKSQMMALVNWYPFYGKLNIFDLGVAHFDVYAIAGYGSMELKSGRHPTYTGGGGVGFWISQHLTARAEVRYQEFKAQHYNGEVEMNTTVLGLQVGYLL